MFEYVGIYVTVGTGVAILLRYVSGGANPPTDGDIVAWQGYFLLNNKKTSEADERSVGKARFHARLSLNNGLWKSGLLWPLLPWFVYKYRANGLHTIFANRARPVKSFLLHLGGGLD